MLGLVTCVDKFVRDNDHLSKETTPASTPSTRGSHGSPSAFLSPTGAQAHSQSHVALSTTDTSPASDALETTAESKSGTGTGTATGSVVEEGTAVTGTHTETGAGAGASDCVGAKAGASDVMDTSTPLQQSPQPPHNFPDHSSDLSSISHEGVKTIDKPIRPVALLLTNSRERARILWMHVMRLAYSGPVKAALLNATSKKNRAEQLKIIRRRCHILVTAPSKLEEALLQADVNVMGVKVSYVTALATHILYSHKPGTHSSRPFPPPTTHTPGVLRGHS